MNAFDVLGDPVRRRLLELLAQGDHRSGELVQVIQEEFGITQAEAPGRIESSILCLERLR